MSSKKNVKKNISYSSPSTSPSASSYNSSASKMSSASVVEPKKSSQCEEDVCCGEEIKVKTTSAGKSPSKRSISSEEKYKMIETAAYYIAEKNCFCGDPIDFWLQAEKEIEVYLAKK